jgi:selenocysteine lyase/cysteine desulfurase
MRPRLWRGMRSRPPMTRSPGSSELGRAGVNVSTTVPEDNPLDTEDRGVHPLIRFSPHYYNTEDEIDHATELVRDLAT